MDVNQGLVERLIASQFPRWAGLPIRSVENDGWDNRTFRLGEEMSVRLPSAECYAGQVEKERAWLSKLAPLVPLAIPMPLAMGVPAHGYPWNWSVNRWLEGENTTLERIEDLERFAIELARFLVALQQVDPGGGPPPGQHNFFRGGPLTTYDRETREAIDVLGSEVDGAAATELWEAALAATWSRAPVWLHGDVAASNLLVRGGRLAAVIDFGCCGIGDPACDLTMAWTFFSGPSRDAFRAELEAVADRATWLRAGGWALWKALITLAEYLDTNASKVALARRTIGAVLDDLSEAR